MGKRKILFVIPHYYKHDPSCIHAYGRETRERRAKQVELCIRTLHETFAAPRTSSWVEHAPYSYYMIDILCEPADTERQYDLDVYVCTTNRGEHLLDLVDVPEQYYTHVETNLRNPLYLGFVCHRLLLSFRGQYDYYCYIEDDSIIHDAAFFQKLRWFEDTFGSDCALQPYRYNVTQNPGGDRAKKHYGDFRFPADWWDVQWPEAGVDFTRDCELETTYLGRPLRFVKATNPHSAGFFLSAAQYDRMSGREGYGEATNRFVSPLESAASWDLVCSFRVYRPALSQASFLEMETF